MKCFSEFPEYKLSTEGTNLTAVTLLQLTSQNGEKQKDFPLIRKKSDIYILTIYSVTYWNLEPESLGKKRKHTQAWKEEVKLTLQISQYLE